MWDALDIKIGIQTGQSLNADYYYADINPCSFLENNDQKV